MKVAIGIPCGELARYSSFYHTLMEVRFPPNSVLFPCRSANVADNRNHIAKSAIENQCDAVWYVDDDQSFSPSTLLRLMEDNKDIVSGLYLQRSPPFIPHIYDREKEDGTVHPRLLRDGETGLVQCDAVGAGSLLVKTKVFEKLERPWWRLGQHDKVGWNDDIDFCRRARQAGFEVWCDLDVMVGHFTSMAVWPYRDRDGKWETILSRGDKPVVSFPAAHYKEEEQICGQ